MNENTLQPLGPESVRPQTSAPSPSKAPAAPAGETSPSFEALLEKLQTHAQVLGEKSQQVSDPEQLSGAVEAAKASLDDAVSLGDRLLEAYREARQQTPDATPDETEHDQTAQEDRS